MKKHYITSLIALAALSASAADLQWTGAVDGVLTNASNWTIKDTSNVPAQIAQSDNLFITSSVAKNYTIGTDEFLNVNDLTVSSENTKNRQTFIAGQYAGLYVAGNVTINAPFNFQAEKSTGSYAADSWGGVGTPTFTVMGNITVDSLTSTEMVSYIGGSNTTGTRLYVAGDLILRNRVTVGIIHDYAWSETEASGRAVIEGIINFGRDVAVPHNPSISIGHRYNDRANQNGNGSTTMLSASGVQGYGIIQAYQGWNNSYYNPSSKATAILRLTNTGYYATGGKLVDSTPDDMQMKILMDGTGTQRFSNVSESGAYSFTGGVEARQGTVEFVGYYSTDGGSTYGKFDSNHGTLTISGGTFKLLNAINIDPSKTGIQSAFGFNDIVYGGGTIELLAGDYLQLANGGTIKLADGYDGDILFNIIDTDDAILFKQKVKIISWDTDTEIDDSRFMHVDGNEWYDMATGNVSHNLVFTSEADGLYAQWIAIPEPAEWAGIFGVIALGFALYRRRK